MLVEHMNILATRVFAVCLVHLCCAPEVLEPPLTA